MQQVWLNTDISSLIEGLVDAWTVATTTWVSFLGEIWQFLGGKFEGKKIFLPSLPTITLQC